MVRAVFILCFFKNSRVLFQFLKIFIIFASIVFIFLKKSIYSMEITWKAPSIKDISSLISIDHLEQFEYNRNIKGHVTLILYSFIMLL